MLVYRVEHPETGRGPYTHAAYKNVNCESYGIDGLSSKKRPMPYSDGLGYDYEHPGHRFGFHDYRKLANWFSKEDKQNLAKHGFVCRVYSVPKKHVRLGSKQLTFDITKSKLVRKSRTIPSA